MDLEKEPLHPTSHAGDDLLDMSAKGALNEDHLDLRVGQKNASGRRSGGARLLSRGLKSIAILLVAFLAANGFWALFYPELYAHNALVSLNGHDDRGHHRHHHLHDHRPHPPHGPPGHGPGHPPPHPRPPHGPPGHEHPPPPPPPPHRPGRGPGGDPPGPPPHPHPHPSPPRGPGKVQECFDLQPGETLEIRSSLDWFGQSVQVAPSLAGSSVTFVWDGPVGPPAPPRRGPRPGPPRPPLKNQKGRDKHDKDEDRDSDEEKPEKQLGDVLYHIQVPSKGAWKDADIAPQDLKICSVRRPDSTGINVFNASGIPPSHARIDPTFHQVASRFNTTIHLPSHFARTAIRAGHFP